ncbi:unnamed protein product [Brassica napus]|uniref:(rape) hypothetical protein n=1 Tax=Brassica napus TaxID=3708 RepID=A0A816R942_BRANA|nr:unnamed protein product [Brassica napus]
MIRFVNLQSRRFAFPSINGNAKIETGIVSLLSTHVVKIEKSHREAGKGNPRWVCLNEDDRNELALSLAGPSDPERKQLSTNGVKVNQLQGHRRTASATNDIGAWIAVSNDGVLHKALGSHLSDLHEKFPASLAS